MTKKTFIKTLSANDVGKTGGHQAGIVVPKGDGDLLAFLPRLDPSKLNPSEWIECDTPEGTVLRLRFVYYNNRLHMPKGTRNEYRLTCLTKFLREEDAQEGDAFEISLHEGEARYRIRVAKTGNFELLGGNDAPIRIKLTTSWHRVH
jgi:hypothetical protein